MVKLADKQNNMVLTKYIKKLVLVLTLFLIDAGVSFAQSITGKLSLIANQEIKLEGFEGFKTYPIAFATIDEKGNFVLNYSKLDYGVAYLIASDNKPLFVILNGENIEIKGEALANPESISVLKGFENQAFQTYAKAHPKREQALSAWLYLEQMYARDSLFLQQINTKRAIATEKQRIKAEDDSFVQQLPKESYVRWFLPIRRLVSSAEMIAQYRPDEVQATIQSFRNIDYADGRLYKSGLFKDAIENHFLLIENSAKPLEQVFREMEISIDAMVAFLLKDEKRLNEVSNFLFDFLERRSLLQVSEYLALKLLNEKNCTLETSLARQLETYRAMKKGSIASEILFEKENFLNSDFSIEKLSNVTSPYTLLVFGASWCPKCTEELPEIAKRYSRWKENGVEVLFIALEENKQAFQTFANAFPFRSYSDLKKWDSKIVNDYYVFATPTLFLIDQNRKIVLRPNSIEQVESWINTLKYKF